MTGPLAKKKYSLAHRIASDLELEFPFLESVTNDWDRERAAAIIVSGIPDSNAEMDEWCAETFKPKEPTGPSLLDQIREAIYADKGMPLKTLLECVLAQLKAKTIGVNDE